MKTYLAHKNEIEGFKDVADTVKTVEKIAATSIHFLKQEVLNLNSYILNTEKVLKRAQLFYSKKDSPLLNKKMKGNEALVVLTGDKGLVGGLWHDVIAKFLDDNAKYKYIIVVGAKGSQYLDEENIKVFNIFKGLPDIPMDNEIKNISNYIFDKFKDDTFSSVDILYPSFISLAEQKSVFVNFLPFTFEKVKENITTDKTLGIPIFEPSKRDIFENILQKYVQIYFYKIIMEGKLSELSARTVSMEHATEKTNESIRKFTLDYTKDRHRFITQKQLESFAAHRTI